MAKTNENNAELNANEAEVKAEKKTLKQTVAGIRQTCKEQKIGKKILIGLGCALFGGGAAMATERLIAHNKQDAIPCEYTEVPAESPVQYMSVTADSNDAQ